MSTQIQYRSGRPQKFTATKEFTLGNTGIKIPVGSEIEFDGTKVTYEGSEPFVVPTVRGAVRMKWLVPSEDFETGDFEVPGPDHAPLTMRKADGGDPNKPREEVSSVTVADEEREVNTVSARNEFAKSQNNLARGRKVVLAEDQEGVIIRSRLKTPTHQFTDLSKVSISSAISAADNTQFDAEEGNPRVITKVASSDKETVSEGITLKTSVGNGTPKAAKGEILTESEGIVVRTSVGSQPAEEGVIEREGIRFKTTNIPAPKGEKLMVPPAVDSEASDSACRTIAKAICSDFPDNYRFGDSPKKKMARIAADYDDRPDVIRAVAAAETDPNIRAQLVAEYPEAFSG